MNNGLNSSLIKILNRYRMNEENDGLDGGYSVNRLFGLKELILENLKPNSIVCEVGCFTGSSSALFAYYCKEVYCVDLFSETFNNLNYEPVFDKVMQEFKNVKKIKSSSVEAAATFDNGKFDLVYIDAGHLYENVMEDIDCWLPKVKQGGFLAGHDYMRDVEKAVKESFGEPDKVYANSSWLKKL